MLDIIRIPIGYLLSFCYKLVPNYAIALLLFALIMKIILFPLGIKQQKNSVRQASLRPKEQAIRNRYQNGDQKQMNEDLMKLYQDEHYSPYGGCLPLIIQLIIVFALYNVVLNPLQYIAHVSSDSITNINYHIVEMCKENEELLNADNADYASLFSDTSRKSIATQVQNLTDGKEVKLTIQGIETVRIIRTLGIQNFTGKNGLGNLMLEEGFDESKLTKFTIIGDKMDLSQTASIKKPSLLWIITVLTFASTFVCTKLTKKFTYQPPTTGNKDAEMSMKIMDIAMPLMQAMFTFTLPAVVAVYWIYQNILSALQQYILKCMFPYPVFTEEDYKKANKEYYKAPTKRLDKKAYKESGKVAAHRIDLIDETPAEGTASQNENNVAEDSGIIPKAALKDESDKNNK